jgi:KaiC/GvpD/RAD55 family RecA-like ATPase
MADIKKELAENRIILAVVSGEKYAEFIVQCMKKLSGSICYLTLNKTYDSMKELFEKKGVNLGDVIFIDAISKTIKDVPDQAKSVYYCSSPGALTEISIAVERFIRHGFDYIVFDSLTNLLIYERKAPVARFVSSLVNKIRESGTKALFLALKLNEQDAMIKETEMFVDKVINA